MTDNKIIDFSFPAVASKKVGHGSVISVAMPERRRRGLNAATQACCEEGEQADGNQNQDGGHPCR
jgi:hypothetical protein